MKWLMRWFAVGAVGLLGGMPGPALGDDSSAHEPLGNSLRTAVNSRAGQKREGVETNIGVKRGKSAAEGKERRLGRTSKAVKPTAAPSEAPASGVDKPPTETSVLGTAETKTEEKPSTTQKTEALGTKSEENSTKSAETAEKKDTPAEKGGDRFLDRLFEGGPQNDRLAKMHEAREDLLAALKKDGHFSEFLKLLEATGFDKTLRGRGPFTVFAPSDEAFAKLPSAWRETVAHDPSRAKTLVAHHVVRGLVSKNVLDHLRNVKTMSSGVVNIDYTSGIRIERGHLFFLDHFGSNGMFHGIDEVLLPPERPSSPAKPPKSPKPNRTPAPTT